MEALVARRRRIQADVVAAYAVATLVAALVVVPLIWLVGSSLKSLDEIFTLSWWPAVPQWRNFVDGLFALNFARYYYNSLVITAVNVIGGGIVASMAGYAFARLEFPGKRALFALVISTTMLPFAAIMIPSFVLFRYMGWIDRYLVMTVPLILAVPAFFIFLMRQFFMTVPQELDDAAKMDACGFYGIYWHILLPLARPALTTVAIYAFMGNWGDLIRPIIFLNSASMRTVPVGLALLNVQSEEPSLKIHLMLSNSVLYMIPPVILYLVFQKYFTRLGGNLSGMTFK